MSTDISLKKIVLVLKKFKKFKWFDEFLVGEEINSKVHEMICVDKYEIESISFRSSIDIGSFC